MTEPFLMPDQDKAFNGDLYVCQEFLRLKAKHGIETAIELGSCVGGTTKWLGENFKTVVSIEINPEFHGYCKERVKGLGNVYALLGDTVDLLQGVLLNCADDKFIVFVDSHWEEKNPLLQELRIIAYRGLKPVIVIHDFVVPGRPELGFDSYGGQDYDWKWIEESINAIYGNDKYTYHYNSEATGAMRGVVFIEPK